MTAPLNTVILINMMYGEHNHHSDLTAFSDEALCLRAQSGSTEAEAELAVRYFRLVKSCARPYFLAGGDSEDLIQEGMIGLFKAVRDYDMGRDASFLTFADLCISRQMYTAVQASKRQKHIPLNTYVSLYSEGAKQEEKEEKKLLESLEDRTELNPEQAFLDKERVAYLEKVIENELSPFEKQVLDLYMTRMPTAQIAKVLGREEKSTDNALQRLKAKIRKLL